MNKSILIFYSILIVYTLVLNKETFAQKPSLKISITDIPYPLPDTLFSCEGIVSDSCTNELLESCLIIIRGKKPRHEYTNLNGYFNLNELSNKDTLIFKAIGYEVKELPIESLPSMLSNLFPKEINMDSVIHTLDSTDVSLIKSVLASGYEYRNKKVENVMIYDSLLSRNLIPSLPNVKFVIISQKEIMEQLRNGGKLEVVLFSGIYKCTEFITIIKKTMQWWYRKSIDKVANTISVIKKYHYKQHNGIWKDAGVEVKNRLLLLKD